MLLRCPCTQPVRPDTFDLRTFDHTVKLTRLVEGIANLDSPICGEWPAEMRVAFDRMTETEPEDPRTLWWVEFQAWVTVGKEPSADVLAPILREFTAKRRFRSIAEALRIQPFERTSLQWHEPEDFEPTFWNPPYGAGDRLDALALSMMGLHHGDRPVMSRGDEFQTDTGVVYRLLDDVTIGPDGTATARISAYFVDPPAPNTGTITIDQPPEVPDEPEPERQRRGPPIGRNLRRRLGGRR